MHFNRQHNDLRAEVNPAIEVNDVLIEHPDAATRRAATDRRRLVGSVDGIDGAAAILRSSTQGIAATARHEARQLGLARNHLCGRDPVRPLGLPRNGLHARPSKALAADSYAVSN